ncbi:hypothetical protein D3C78_1029760 [compost metagenome]
MTMVPLMVVALRMSVPASIGRLPSSANSTITAMPTAIAFCPRSRPASCGSSRPASLARLEKVESRVEPAAETITTVITSRATRPIDLASVAGTLSEAARPLSWACTPIRLKARMAKKPSTPATTKARRMLRSSQMKPRSVSTGSWNG